MSLLQLAYGHRRDAAHPRRNQKPLNGVRLCGSSAADGPRERRGISLCAGRHVRRSEREKKKRRPAPFEMTGKKGQRENASVCSDRNDGLGGPRRAERLRTERLRRPKRRGISSHKVRAMARWFSLRGEEGRGISLYAGRHVRGSERKKKERRPATFEVTGEEGPGRKSGGSCALVARFGARGRG